MSNENPHMNLWRSVEKTDPEHTRAASLNGMTITAINPQYQRMQATAKFGPFGIGWGIKDVKVTQDSYDEGKTILASYTATLWYMYEGKKGEFPIVSTGRVAYMTNKGYTKVDDEWYKKVATDALTKGLSFLGFSADVFLGRYDDSRYVNKVQEEHNLKADLDHKQHLAELKVKAIALKDIIAGHYNRETAIQIAEKCKEDAKGNYDYAVQLLQAEADRITKEASNKHFADNKPSNEFEGAPDNWRPAFEPADDEPKYEEQD